MKDYFGQRTFFLGLAVKGVDVGGQDMGKSLGRLGHPGQGGGMVLFIGEIHKFRAGCGAS